MKTLNYYTIRQYGNERQFLEPSHTSEVKALQRLTGRITITDADRKALAAFNDKLEFKEVLPPKS